MSPRVAVPLLTVPLLMLGSVASAADDVASDYWVRVQPSAWFVGFKGETQYSANNVPGNELKLNDVDLANQETGIGVEVGAKLPILFSFHAGGYVVGTDGSYNATGVTFGGQTFNGAVDSKLDVSDLYGEADLQILDLDLVGCAIGLGYHFMNTQVEMTSAGASAKLDEDVQFPVVTLRGHANLPILTSLGAEAKIHWMDLSLGDTSVSYLDATLQIIYRPWEYLGFIGGYRYVAADLHFDKPAGTNASAKVDLTLDGPFLGITAQF